MDWRVLEREEVELGISDDALLAVAVVSEGVSPEMEKGRAPVGGEGSYFDSYSPSTGAVGVPK